MDNKLLDLLVCPASQQPLYYDKKAQELICKTSRLAYPVKDGIPYLVAQEARTLTEEAIAKLPS